MKLKLLIVFSIFPTIFIQAQVSRVDQLNSSFTQGGLDQTNQILAMNNNVYLNARTQSNGKELFTSNGIGVSLVKDLNGSPTNFSGNPNIMFYRSFTNEIFFRADDAPTPSNFELWKTDGSSGGTVKVHEFNTNGSSNPRRFTEFNNEVFFAVTGYNTGEELGFSDGTSAGSGIIEIMPGVTGSEPQRFKKFNGELYFSAATSYGRELWKTDGTQVGTVLVKDINSGANDSNPEELIVFDNRLYFVAEDTTNGRELWTTDGTTSGTQIVSDLNSGTVDSNPNNLTVFKGRLFFSAITAATGREIFTALPTNGGITLFRDIVTGTTGCNAEKFFHYTAQNILLFVAGNGNTNKELWYTNGSLVFTNQVKDINVGSSSSSINSINSNFAEYNGKVYFGADDGSNGNEVWVTDGTTVGTEIISDIYSGTNDSNPSFLTVANNTLFFRARKSDGYELYKYIDPALSINEFELNNIKLYPNPASNNITIDSKTKIDSVEIFDALGKSVLVFNESLSTYSINSLNSGLYFVKINGEGKEITKKLIKN